MIPRLLSFYGRAPGPSGDWLDVPPKWFWAYVQMMPELQAEQALTAISVTAAGSGCMEEQDQRGYLQELRRAAAGGKAPRAIKATAATLAQIGIKVSSE